MTASSLIVLNASERRRLGEWLAGMLGSWQEEWCAAGVCLASIEARDASEAAGLESLRWLCGRRADGRCVWVGVEATAGALTLFVPAPSEDDAAGAGELCHELERSALQALALQLLQGPIGTAALVSWSTRPPDANVMRPLHGGAAAVCRFEDVDIHLVLDAEVIEPALVRRAAVNDGRPGDMGAVRQVLASQRIAIEVSIESAELPLGEVATLTTGDVIALPHGLNAPIAIRLIGGDALCAGHLGMSGGRKAIQLTSTDGNDEV